MKLASFKIGNSSTWGVIESEEAIDVGALLRKLSEQGYAGPVGLQHFGIGGDARENLGRSIGAWRKLAPAAR